MKKKNLLPGITALEHSWIKAQASTEQSAQYLMIVLHGRGDSLDSFTTIRDELKIPEMNYLLVNAPRAYDGGFSWYAFEPNQKAGILKSRAKLLQLINELGALGWSPNKIFLYGFSQGSLLSCDFAMFASLQLAGIVAISGYIYFFEEWKKSLKPSAFQTPWLITHGLQDDLLPVVKTREQVQKLRDVGLPITWKEFMKDHEIDLHVETSFIRKWVRSKMVRNRRPTYPPMHQTSSSNSKQRFKSF